MTICLSGFFRFLTASLCLCGEYWKVSLFQHRAPVRARHHSRVATQPTRLDLRFGRLPSLLPAAFNSPSSAFSVRVLLGISIRIRSPSFTNAMGTRILAKVSSTMESPWRAVSAACREDSAALFEFSETCNTVEETFPAWPWPPAWFDYSEFRRFAIAGWRRTRVPRWPRPHVPPCRQSTGSSAADCSSCCSAQFPPCQSRPGK